MIYIKLRWSGSHIRQNNHLDTTLEQITKIPPTRSNQYQHQQSKTIMIELFYKTCVQPGFIHMHTHTQAHTYTMFTQQTGNAVELKAHLFSVLTLNLSLRWVCMSVIFATQQLIWKPVIVKCATWKSPSTQTLSSRFVMKNICKCLETWLEVIFNK